MNNRKYNRAKAACGFGLSLEEATHRDKILDSGVQSTESYVSTNLK